MVLYVEATYAIAIPENMIATADDTVMKKSKLHISDALDDDDERLHISNNILHFIFICFFLFCRFFYFYLKVFILIRFFSLLCNF
jgi:hypothetical protein